MCRLLLFIGILDMYKPYSVYEKAKSESLTSDASEQFNRVESRFSKANRAKIAAKLEEYRKGGHQMSFFALTQERHSSRRLGEFMRACDIPRPGPRWDAHHIVSGAHPEAELSRAVLADEDIKIRIDDPDNGCWMPKTKNDARPTIYPNAIGHNRIHRQKYYDWIYNKISFMPDDGSVRAFFRTVRRQLLDGNISDQLLQEEIDGAEYKSWLKRTR